MNKKSYSKSIGAFTLIEMIGVLAIVGVLAAIVAPRVTEALRDGRVSSALATVQAVKSSSDRYLDRYRAFPPDGSVQATTPEGQNYTRTYGDKAAISQAAQSTFGDILLGQGYLEKMNFDIGNRTTNAIAPAVTGSLAGDITNLAASPGSFATVRAMTVTNALAGGVFTPTKNRDLPHQVVFVYIPALPLQEAVALKTKVDGPFPPTQIPSGNLSVITNAVGAFNATAEPLTRGNCRLRVASGTAGALNSTYDAYIYVTHD